MTGESASSTEPWIEKHGAKYAYAYDKTLGLMRATGQSGLPSSVLVDASGTILYVGHPASINASLIERAVQGALTKPIYDWPKELSGVAKAIRKGNLGDAVTEVQKLGDAHADIAAAVQNMVKARVSAVERARDDKDWLRVVTLGEPLVKGLGKLPEAAQVEAILDALDGDKEAKAVLKAQQKVAKYFAGDIKKNQFDRVQKDLEKIAEEFSGTAAARDARDGLEKLRAMRKE